MEPELDNIRAALQLAANLTYFWQGRGHITEGRHWLSEALLQVEGFPAENSRDQKALKAKALWSPLLPVRSFSGTGSAPFYGPYE